MVARLSAWLLRSSILTVATNAQLLHGQVFLPQALEGAPRSRLRRQEAWRLQRVLAGVPLSPPFRRAMPHSDGGQNSGRGRA
jgi:hypothetical protein